MKSLFIAAILLLASLSNAQNLNPVQTKKLAEEMTVFTRTMDLLMAREEMKESRTFQIVASAIKMNSLSTSEDIEKKVQLLSNDESLKNCQVTHVEKPVKDGKADALLEYKGADCPISLTAKVQLAMSEMGGSGQVDVQFKILSEKLQNELDITTFNMPMKLQVTVKPVNNGVSILMVTQVKAQILSKTIGAVTFAWDVSNAMELGQTIKANMVNVETYSSGNQKIKFEQRAETLNDTTKESFFINDKAVSKEEYEKNHTALSVPGFDDTPTPLAQPQVCSIKTYNVTENSLEKVREAIKNKTDGSLKVAEKFDDVNLFATGKLEIQGMLGGQMVQIEVATTPDAARFNISKPNNNNKPGEFLGRLTAVLGENVELTKVILNRVVRVSCHL